VSALTKDDVEIADQEGRSFRSTNASTAATFTALGLPESGNWYSLWRAPSGVGYASGTGQIIGYSATGIAPWTKQNPTGLTETAVLRGVAAADLNNAWAVGSTVAGAGTIRHTSDGSTWAGQTSNTTKALFGVSAWSATQAVAVGDAGTAMYTNDGGTTWLTGNTGGVTDDLFSVVAVVTPGGQQRAIAVGANGRVIISDDAGATWTATTAGACRLRGVGSADGMVIYAGCPTGTLERSIDGGSTWSALTPPLANQIYGVSMPDPQTVLFVESGGIVIRSVNADVANPASVTFVTVSNSGSSIYSVDANDANHFSIGGDSGSFKRSLDGTTLLTDTTGSTNDILGVVQVDAVKSWAVGESGRITMTNSIGTVNDFVTATNGWGTSTANSIFGVCLQSVAGSANPDWAVDTGNISGKCEPLVGDAWQAVPGAPTNLAGDHAKIADHPVGDVRHCEPGLGLPSGLDHATRQLLRHDYLRRDRAGGLARFSAPYWYNAAPHQYPRSTAGHQSACSHATARPHPPDRQVDESLHAARVRMGATRLPFAHGAAPTQFRGATILFALALLAVVTAVFFLRPARSKPVPSRIVPGDGVCTDEGTVGVVLRVDHGAALVQIDAGPCCLDRCRPAHGRRGQRAPRDARRRSAAHDRDARQRQRQR